MDTGKKIELLRKQKGMSQESLADKLQVSRQSVFKWESGESTPSIDKLKELAKIFNVSLDDLLIDKNEILSKQIDKPKETKYRDVFVNKSYARFDDDVAIQSGYFTGDKHLHADVLVQFENANKSVLESISYNNSIMFCADSNSRVLIDTTNNTFSIYHGTAEQFICPFENLVSILLTDSGSRTVINKENVSGGAIGLNGSGGVMFGSNNTFGKGMPAIYYIEFNYHQKNGEMASFKFTTSAYRNHLLYTKDYRDVNLYKFYIDGVCNQIKNSLIKIKDSIETSIKEASTDKELKEIDFDSKKKNIESANQLCAPILTELHTTEAKSDRKMKAIVIIFKVILPILLGLGVIIFFILFFKKYF